MQMCEVIFIKEEVLAIFNSVLPLLLKTLCQIREAAEGNQYTVVI